MKAITLLLLLFTGSVFSQIPTHQAFSKQLNQFVSSDGIVDYAGWKKQEADLDRYLAELAKSTPQGYWSRSQALAYWINTYNAFTIKLILENYPLNSIKDLHDGNPWAIKWITLAGKTYSLNQIENEIIRPQFKEPRIHFAVNCAAASCPPLLNEAFKADQLEKQLEKQTRKFINNSTFNKLDGNTLKVSKIFDWYGEDFGTLKAYLNNYRTPQIAASTSITFMAYDWALNSK